VQGNGEVPGGRLTVDEGTDSTYSAFMEKEAILL
jgi:hypothetical protein